MTGYVKAQRERFKHPLFRGQKFCRGYAWDWMCAQAAYADREVSVKGKTITLKRGQFCHSIRFMADVFGWDRSASDRFLTRLKTESMIETSTETGQLVVTICNYDFYQGAGAQGETATETPTETEVRQERDRSETNNKKVKNIKKEKPPHSPPKGAPFSDFWEAAWGLKRQDKANAEKAWRKLSEADREEAMSKTAAWCKWWKAEHPTLSDIRASSYLNGKRWQDEISTTKPAGGPPTPGTRRTLADGRVQEFAGAIDGWLEVHE